jgi:hypothetical protein
MLIYIFMCIGGGGESLVEDQCPDARHTASQALHDLMIEIAVAASER